MKRAKLDYYDVAELAIVISGGGPECHDNPLDAADMYLADKFNISFDDFHNLIELLVPLCRCDVSALTMTTRCGFAHEDFYIVKDDF